MWNDDLCSFVDVTAGLGMLHTVMYRLREICAPALPIRDMSRRILFASLAGNQHTFGLQMVTEVFRHAGWDVTVETAAAEADLPDIVRSDWFAVAGLSIARHEQTRNLGRTIRAIRQASFNKTIGILVGGPVFDTQPDLGRRVGADVDACDAKQAVLRAEGLRLLMASLEQDLPGRQP
jgi:methanogenic corrinoid protein MtbC1